MLKVIGIIYAKDNSGKYCSLLLDGDLKNIASFIAKCPPETKVEITDILDLPILSTIGNFIDRISSNYLDLRNPLVEILIPMIQGDVEPEPIRFAYEPSMGGMSKEEYVEWVYELTGYRLS